MIFRQSNRCFKNTSSSWLFEFDAVFKFIFIFATGLIAAEELIYYVIWFKFLDKTNHWRDAFWSKQSGKTFVFGRGTCVFWRRLKKYVLIGT